MQQSFSRVLLLLCCVQCVVLHVVGDARPSEHFEDARYGGLGVIDCACGVFPYMPTSILYELKRVPPPRGSGVFARFLLDCNDLGLSIAQVVPGGVNVVSACQRKRRRSVSLDAVVPPFSLDVLSMGAICAQQTRPRRSTLAVRPSRLLAPSPGC